MYFLPVSLALFLILLLLIPVLFVMAPAVAFSKLGLNPISGYLFFILCLIGGGINIPIKRERVPSELAMDGETREFLRFFGVKVPEVSDRILAINLGGAILPGALCLYLLSMAPLAETFLATVVTSAVSYKVSRPVRGIGIVMPTFVPPVVAAAAAVLIARDSAPQVAYVSGVLGTLIGADLLRLPQMKEMGSTILSIGGAGVFDGIYLVGLVSVLLA
jgi:uncharacterized membrane protein